MPALTADEIADVVRDQVWTVRAAPSYFPDTARTVTARSRHRGRDLDWNMIVDMAEVERFRYPLPALYDMLLSMQDAVVRLAREVR